MGKSGSTRSAPPGGAVWRRRLAFGALGVVTVMVLLTGGRRLGSLAARQCAASKMLACQFGPAQRWLAWSAWLDSGDYRTDLLEAACHRQSQEMDAWAAKVDQAQRKGAPRDRLAAEVKLGRLQAGGLSAGAESEMPGLAAAGVPQGEILLAFLRGYLARRDLVAARLLLETALQHAPDRAQRDYLWAVFFAGKGDSAEAETRLNAALRAQPGHELARNQLAELFVLQNKPALALEQYAELAMRSGGIEKATLGMARQLRQLARTGEARDVLSPLAAQPEPGPLVQLEMAQIELELGNYEEAERRFARVNLDKVKNAPLAQVALNLGLGKKPLEAEAMFAKVGTAMSRNGWIAELQLRLTKDSADRAAAEELERLNRPPSAPASGLPGPSGEAAAGAASPAARLYRLHCHSCHGPRGDGRGPAASPLFPRPRDFRADLCRLVSTRNGVPTLEDVERAIEQGMPGTSMQPFRELAASDRRLLAQEVVRLRREGLREQLAAALRQEGEEVDEAEIGRTVQRLTTPGEPVRVPAHWPEPGQVAAQGKARFAALGCVKCHGDDGRGAADQPLFDALGEPTRPRDLVHEPFKGGHEPASIYLRIAAGMPGTAHPAASNLSEEDLIELVEHVRSLSRTPPYQFTNHERRSRASTSAYLGWLRKPNEHAGEKFGLESANRLGRADAD